MFRKYLIFLPLIIAFAVLSINLNKPFIGHHDFMSVVEGSWAKSYLKGDFTVSSTHHPPLYPILIAISFAMFGVAEWSERIIPIIFSLISVVYIYLIVKKLWGEKASLLASAFYIGNPMFIYFGSLPSSDFGVVSMSLAGFYYYLRYLESKKTSDFVLLLLCIFIGGLIDWTVGYMPATILVHSFLIRQFSIKLLIPGIVAVLCVFLLLLQNFLISGQFINAEIIETLKYRVSDNKVSFGGIDFSYISYFRQEISVISAYFTKTMIILSGIWIVSFLLNKKVLSPKIDKASAFILSLLIFGIFHPTLFSRYVFIHDFLNIYLLPFFSVTAALGVLRIIEYLKKRKVNAIVYTSIVIVILLVFVFEKISFSKALLKTEMNRPGQEMANLLNALQSGDRQAVIVSPRFDSFFGPFASFYTNYRYDVTSEEQLKKNIGKYRFVVMIDEDISDKNYFEYLNKMYPIDRKGDWTIIYLP